MERSRRLEAHIFEVERPLKAAQRGVTDDTPVA